MGSNHKRTWSLKHHSQLWGAWGISQLSDLLTEADLYTPVFLSRAFMEFGGSGKPQEVVGHWGGVVRAESKGDSLCPSFL